MKPISDPFPGSEGTLASTKAVRGYIQLVGELGISQKIEFQYNPENLRRQLTPKIVGGDGESRASAMYYTAPPTETITVRVEIDATAPEEDLAWEKSETLGVRPVLAALELTMYPKSLDIQAAQAKLSAGSLEVGSYDVPLLLFSWGQDCQAPVRITSYAVTEDAFNKDLVPLRATVDLTMQVISAQDVRPGTTPYQRYIQYQQAKEKWAKWAYKLVLPGMS
jgi:hypothetical protein